MADAQKLPARETAGEDLPEMHAAVVKRAGLIYKVKNPPASERGMTVTTASSGEPVWIVWGEDSFLRSPQGKAALAYGTWIGAFLMVGLDVGKPWPELSAKVQEAWAVIGDDWFASRSE